MAATLFPYGNQNLILYNFARKDLNILPKAHTFGGWGKLYIKLIEKMKNWFLPFRRLAIGDWRLAIGVFCAQNSPHISILHFPHSPPNTAALYCNTSYYHISFTIYNGRLGIKRRPAGCASRLLRKRVRQAVFSFSCFPNKGAKLRMKHPAHK
jgi:hypothetical protein